MTGVKRVALRVEPTFALQGGALSGCLPPPIRLCPRRIVPPPGAVKRSAAGGSPGFPSSLEPRPHQFDQKRPTDAQPPGSSARRELRGGASGSGAKNPTWRRVSRHFEVAPAKASFGLPTSEHRLELRFRISIVPARFPVAP
jgi:hypothetical protein